MIVTSYPSSCRLVSVLAAMLVALAIYYSTIPSPQIFHVLFHQQLMGVI